MVKTQGNMAEFNFYRPNAQRVCIVGDFNGWRDNELLMSRDERGYWTAKVYLPQGDFRFRYRADGEWYVNFAAFGVEWGDFGLDSVVRIAAPKPTHAPKAPAHKASKPARLQRAKRAAVRATEPAMA